MKPESSLPPSGLLEIRHYGDLDSSDCHDFHQIVIGLAGHMDIVVAGRGGRVGARNGCLIPAGTRHDYVGVGDNRQLVFDLPVDTVAAERPFARPAFFTLDTALARLIGRLRDGLSAVRPLLHPLQGALLDAVTERIASRRAPSRTGPCLDFGKIEAFMRAHLDAPVTTMQLAAVAGMSPRHFHDRFVEIAGETPYRHLSRLRLEQAASMLRHDAAPLSEIALATGFNDQSAFTHAFRAHFGMPPHRWRCRRI